MAPRCSSSAASRTTCRPTRGKPSRQSHLMRDADHRHAPVSEGDHHLEHLLGHFSRRRRSASLHWRHLNRRARHLHRHGRFPAPGRMPPWAMRPAAPKASRARTTVACFHEVSCCVHLRPFNPDATAPSERSSPPGTAGDRAPRPAAATGWANRHVQADRSASRFDRPPSRCRHSTCLPR